MRCSWLVVAVAVSAVEASDSLERTSTRLEVQLPVALPIQELNTLLMNHKGRYNGSSCIMNIL